MTGGLGKGYTLRELLRQAVYEREHLHCDSSRRTRLTYTFAFAYVIIVDMHMFYSDSRM